MPYIGQTWGLASIGAAVEIGVLSTLKRLLMESILNEQRQCPLPVKTARPQNAPVETGLNTCVAGNRQARFVNNWYIHKIIMVYPI
jgi:hypothetical protein